MFNVGGKGSVHHRVDGLEKQEDFFPYKGSVHHRVDGLEIVR